MIRERLERALRVRLGTAVARLMHESEGTFVEFKRYRDPQRFGGAAGRVLDQIKEGARPVADVLSALPISAEGYALPLLRSLERERIVDLFLPDHLSVATLIKDEGR